MQGKNNKLLIKNMVCQRCILSVQNVFNSLNIPFEKVQLGEVDLTTELTNSEKENLNGFLVELGFEIIETRIKKIIEDIKQVILEYLSNGIDNNLKLSSFITNKIPYDYSYLSDLFSSIEGKTIEQFFILQRIEKVKEMLVYDQLSLTEISYHTGFSSVHHLSSQFKKVTGLTPSHFKKIGVEKRKAKDSF